MASVASDLGVSGQTIYNWRRQEWIDISRAGDVTSSEHVGTNRSERCSRQAAARMAIELWARRGPTSLALPQARCLSARSGKPAGGSHFYENREERKHIPRSQDRNRNCGLCIGFRLYM